MTAPAQHAPRPLHPRADPGSLDALIGARLRSTDYPTWRAQVEATGGCAAPIRLTGSSRFFDRDGATLLERDGTCPASRSTGSGHPWRSIPTNGGSG